VSSQLHAPAALPQGKSPWYPLDWRLGGPQSLSGHGGEEINSHPLSGLEEYKDIKYFVVSESYFSEMQLEILRNT